MHMGYLYYNKRCLFFKYFHVLILFETFDFKMNT